MTVEISCTSVEFGCWSVDICCCSVEVGCPPVEVNCWSVEVVCCSVELDGCLGAVSCSPVEVSGSLLSSFVLKLNDLRKAVWSLTTAPNLLEVGYWLVKLSLDLRGRLWHRSFLCSEIATKRRTQRNDSPLDETWKRKESNWRYSWERGYQYRAFYPAENWFNKNDFRLSLSVWLIEMVVFPRWSASDVETTLSFRNWANDSSVNLVWKEVI